MKNNLLILFALSLALPVFGQVNIDRSDIEKINKTYAEHDKFRIEAELVLYPNHTTQTRFETEKTTLQRSDKNLLHRLSNIETLTTEHLRICADHDDKSLMVDSLRQALPTQLTTYDLNEALKNCSKGSTRTEGKLKICRLEMASGEVETIEIRFEATTWRLERIVLYYATEEKLEVGRKAEKPRLEIVYLKQDFNPVFETGTFSTGRFIEKTKDGWRPAARLRQYRFFNQSKI